MRPVPHRHQPTRDRIGRYRGGQPASGVQGLIETTGDRCRRTLLPGFQLVKVRLAVVHPGGQFPQREAALAAETAQLRAEIGAAGQGPDHGLTSPVTVWVIAPAATAGAASLTEPYRPPS